MIAEQKSLIKRFQFTGKEDVDLQLLETPNAAIGQSVMITLQLSNRSPQRRTVTIFVSINSVFFTGINAKRVKRDRAIVTLAPFQSEFLFFLCIEIFKNKKSKSPVSSLIELIGRNNGTRPIRGALREDEIIYDQTETFRNNLWKRSNNLTGALIAVQCSLKLHTSNNFPFERLAGFSSIRDSSLLRPG